MLLLALLVTSLSDCSAPPVSHPVGWRRQALFVSGSGDPWCRLGGGTVVAGSESVYVDAQRLAPGEYLIDLERGCLVLLKRPDAWSAIAATYWVVRFSGQAERYQLRELQKADRTGSGIDLRSADTDTAAVRQAAATLRLSGSKTVGVTLGGVEGTGISQATRLTVSGNLEGVDIDAELSDQSSPIAPEGSTRELEEFERIAIALRGESWRGQFGDVELMHCPEGFGRLERRATGGLLSARLGGATFGVGYARPRGQFGRTRTTGIDGVQGPYVLAPDGRSVRIVPGSEEVFLDGRPRVRGWDADYTIDYATGELVFTNRCIINSRSRIEVSFQYAIDYFRREDITATCEYELGALLFAVGWLREGDDADDPLVDDLTPEQRQYLGSIGGDTARAWLDGGTFVGANKGEYVRIDDHYEYVGPDSGEYRVRFTPVTEMTGQYVYDDVLQHYRYIGEAAGDYVAQVRAELPRRLNLASVGVRAAVGGLRCGIGGVFQRDQLNLYAPGGAATDDGAVDVNLAWTDTSYSIEYAGRLQSDGFSFPGVESRTDLDRRWGTSDADQADRHQATLNAQPLPGLGLTVDGGVLLLPGSTATRFGALLRGGPGRVGFERVRDQGRMHIELAPTLGWLRPRAEWRMENARLARRTELGGGLGLDLKEQRRVLIEHRLTLLDTVSSVGGGLVADGADMLTQGRLDWSLGDRLSTSVLVGRQARGYADENDIDWASWFGNSILDAHPWQGVRIRGDLSRSSRRVQLRDEVFRYVGPGNGDHARDSLSGRYYPDPDGQYLRELVAKGRFARANETSVASWLELSAYDPASFSASMNWLRIDSDSSSLQELVSYDCRASLRQFEPGLSGFIGSAGSATDDHTLGTSRRASLRVRHFAEAATSRLAMADLRARVENTLYRREPVGIEPDYAELGWRYELKPLLRGMLGFELSIAHERRRVHSPLESPELDWFRVEDWEIGLSRTWQMRRHTRLTVTLDAAYRSAEVDRLPFELDLTRPLGLSRGGGLDISSTLSDVLTLGLRYRVDVQADREPEQAFSSELRAHF